MKFSIVILALLGVFLAPALAGRDGEKKVQRHHGENSHHSDSEDGSKALKTVWDITTGYVATKVFSKNTCIIANVGRTFWTDEPQGHKGALPHHLPHRGNRFIISKKRLGSLSPYGKRIQALCRGIPSYFAYPAPGSNFLEQEVSCLRVKIKDLPVYYCD